MIVSVVLVLMIDLVVVVATVLMVDDSICCVGVNNRSGVGSNGVDG